ncbi:MAG TPA: transporter substrate-binding domain-containing protein [Kiritimatiellia bacterium]|nr:transporter substrate-binding domain-containing protein [Kiritimatiellia bacterium]
MRSKSNIWATAPAPRPAARRWGLAFLLAAALAAGCQALRPATSGELRIGVAADSPPLFFRQGRRASGLEADLGRAFAARLGLKPTFVACAPAELEAALLGGKIDVLMGGTTLTEERRVQMDFAAPYLVVGQAALIRAADLPRLNTAIKIRSAPARVGTVAGSAGESHVARYFTRAARVSYPDPAAAAEALRAGQIDLFVYDGPAIWWLALQHRPDLVLAPALFDRAEVAWAFRRGSVSLRESANEALAAWQQDGTLEALLKRWLPVSK